MAENKISKDEIKKLGELSGLDVSGQADKLSNILSDTLEYINTLEELDTSSVEETFQVTGLKNVFQNKNLNSGISREEALSNANKEVSGLFSTKAVFKK